MNKNLESILTSFRKLPANSNHPVGEEFSSDDKYNQLLARFIRFLDELAEPINETDARTLLLLDPLPKPFDWIRRLKIVRFSKSEELYTRVRSDIEKCNHAPFSQAEVKLILEEPMDRWAHFLEATNAMYTFMQKREVDGSDRTLRLSNLNGYMEFAEETFKEALLRIERVHSGEDVYESDKARALEDAHLLGRMARIGLSSDTDWCRETLPELWRLSSFAPNERSKTTPSQALTLQIAQAVVEYPLRYAVLAMGVVHVQTRHAGLKKKLTAHRKRAETAMISHPGFLRELPVNEPLPKKLKSSLKRALERMYFENQTVKLFPDSFAAHLDVAPLVASLVWHVKRDNGIFAALSNLKDGARSWVGLDGMVVEMEDKDEAMLWHPIDASSEERTAWRERLYEIKVSQPFAQVDREHYRPKPEELETSKCDMFSGYEIGTDPVYRVATGLGWKKNDDNFSLDISGLRFRWSMGGSIYPNGINDTRNLELVEGAESLGQLDPRMLSEVLRQIDLFTSIGIEATGTGYWSSDDPFRPGEKSFESRLAAVKTLFARDIAEGKIILGRRHIEVNGMRLHLGTLRLTRNGDPIEAPSLSGVSFLPYHDAKLKKSVQIITAISASY